MPACNSLFRLLGIVALAAVAFTVFFFAHQPAEAQQRARAKPPVIGPLTLPAPRYGGYSMSLSEVWGLPEMPPPPTDFGPHFDFPPESLNGPPLRDPYMN